MPIIGYSRSETAFSFVRTVAFSSSCRLVWLHWTLECLTCMMLSVCSSPFSLLSLYNIYGCVFLTYWFSIVIRIYAHYIIIITGFEIPSNLWYKAHLKRKWNCWSLRCSWSSACRLLLQLHLHSRLYNSMDWAKTTAIRDEKYSTLGIRWTYIRGLTVCIIIHCLELGHEITACGVFLVMFLSSYR